MSDFLNGRVTLHAGDCMEVLPTLAESSVDSVVTDPPYHLTSIVKRFGGSGAYGGGFKADGKGTGAAFARMSRGFMGKQWDGGDLAFRPALWAEVLRVLKPGGHLLAFSGSRTYHRMACAIEDAGFEIRDQIMWVYGSGFPKSHAVDKHIDRMQGAQRGTKAMSSAKLDEWKVRNGGQGSHWVAEAYQQGQKEVQVWDDVPVTDAARQWQGWGTALKPSHEPLVLARKPLIGTVAENALEHGTGAINVDGCRIPCEERPVMIRTATVVAASSMSGQSTGATSSGETTTLGRWPANLIHDGSDEVEEAFAAFGASRFFYTAKADAQDRLSSRHPTVKPLDLMQYLVRLITPPGGLVLDLFAGTGTTGEAAFREGMRAVLIEREEEYQADIARRMELVYADNRERKAVADRARNKVRVDRHSDTADLFRIDAAE